MSNPKNKIVQYMYGFIIAGVVIAGSLALNAAHRVITDVHNSCADTATAFNSSRLETSGHRKIPSVTPVLKDGVLIIESTDGSDWIEVQQTDIHIIVHAFSKDRSEQLGQYEFPITDVSRIQFFGNDGDDRFIAGYNNEMITTDCFIDTGTGSNFIVGGRGDNTFVNNGTASSMFIWLGAVEVRDREWINTNKETGIEGHFRELDGIRTPGNNRWAKGTKKVNLMVFYSYHTPKKPTEHNILIVPGRERRSLRLSTGLIKPKTSSVITNILPVAVSLLMVIQW